MAFTSDLYTYTPLEDQGDIRLLTLYKGAKDDPLLCTLAKGNLQRKPHYEALSYCWGSPHDVQPLQLDSLSINIHANLQSALWHLRLQREDRVLWVDALCINQNDIVERNHQVRLMGNIYTSARKTLVWLGPGTNDSDRAINLLARVLYGRVLTKDEWKPLRELCDRDYWTRVWILQEFGLASDVTVHCGWKSVNWRAFEMLLPKRDRYSIKHGHLVTLPEAQHRDALSPTRAVIEYRTNHIESGQNNQQLFLLMGDFNDRQCMDPRDKIYALLAMAADSQFDQFEVDYSKSLFAVYCDVLYLYSPSFLKNQGKLRLHEHSGNFLVMLFSQLLQWILQDALKDISFPGSFKPPWIYEPVSAADMKFGIRQTDLFMMYDPVDDSTYRHAQSSLRSSEPSISAQVLDWLDAEIGDSVEGSLEFYQKWPMNFPAEVRQLSKLQLFVATYGKKDLLGLEMTKSLVILVVLAGEHAHIVVERDIGSFVIDRNPNSILRNYLLLHN